MTERVRFALNKTVVLGVACDLVLEMESGGHFRPDSFFINVLCPGFAYITHVELDGISMLVKGVTEDAYLYSTPQKLEGAPMLKQSFSMVKVVGKYTGLIPRSENCKEGQEYRLSFEFIGST